jgi:hypothetical protein
MEEFFTFKLQYNDKLDKLSSMAVDSEFYQLKMMICGKLKIYDMSKLVIIFNNRMLQNVMDNELLQNIFSSSKRDKGDILLIIKAGEKSPITLNNELNKSYSENTLISSPDKKHRPQRETQLPTQSCRPIIYPCKCNPKYESSHLCLRCSLFICDGCKKREPHLLHSNEIISITKFPSYMNLSSEKILTNIEERILSDEAYLFLNDFQNNLTTDIEHINKNYEHMKSLLEEIKNAQINYLLQTEEKLGYKEKTSEVNEMIDLITEKCKSIMLNDIKSEDLNEELLLTTRSIILGLSESINEKYKLVSKYLYVYMSGIRDMNQMNKILMTSLREKFLQTQTVFNIAGLSSKLSTLTKSEFIQNANPPPMEQVIMRMKSHNTVLYYKVRKNNTKSLKTRNFINNCNFKFYFQENDEIELNVENKLFILTGKKYNQLFLYEYEKNEISHLSELNNSHYFGNLIYVPVNNCIYCIGGFNSKKCEIYRNDEVLFSNFAQEIKMNNNTWTNIADLNISRQEFSSVLFNTYLYVFFGFNQHGSANTNKIERLNVLKNDIWEIIHYTNPQSLNLCLSSQAALCYNDSEILLLGGFDGKNYKDSILSFNTEKNSIVSLKDIKIPGIKKLNFYQFFKESAFIPITQFENVVDDEQYNFALFDSKETLHLINTRRTLKYEIIPNSG